MPDRAGGPLVTALQWVAAFTAAALIGLCAVTIALRVRYPFELEWMEGSMVDHVRRVLAGQRLYVPPSLEFTPYLYTPFFYYVSAVVAAVIGVGFLPLRLVSIVSTVGAVVLIGWFVHRETRSVRAGWLAAGLFAATYRLGGAWLDVGRVDSLFLVLVLGALALLRFGTSATAWAAAGGLFTLGFLTKQVGLVIAAPMVAFALLTHPRRGLALAVVTLGGIGGLTALLDLLHDGWFRYYVFEIPRGHALEPRFYAGYWTQDLLRPLWPAMLVGMGALGWRLWSRHRGESTWFYVAVSVGILGSSWMGRLHTGGWENVLIPAHALLAILFGLGTHALERFAPRPGLAAAVAATAFVVQAALLAHDPREEIPTAADVRAGERFLDLLRRTPGDVWVFDHGYLPTLAGKRAYAPAAAIWDVLRGNGGPAADSLYAQILDVVDRGRFTALVIDTQREFPVDATMTYWEAAHLFADEGVFFPATGFRKRPEVLLVPWRGPHAGDAAWAAADQWMSN